MVSIMTLARTQLRRCAPAVKAVTKHLDPAFSYILMRWQNCWAINQALLEPPVLPRTSTLGSNSAQATEAVLPGPASRLLRCGAREPQGRAGWGQGLTLAMPPWSQS